MISAGSKRILGFDNDSLMWCHLALEMKNVKLALIIFHLFSKWNFLQEGSINCLQTAGFDQGIDLNQLQAASRQWYELWVKGWKNKLLDPYDYFVPYRTSRRRPVCSSVLEHSKVFWHLVSLQTDCKADPVVWSPVLWGSVLIWACIRAWTNLASSSCWFRADM